MTQTEHINVFYMDMPGTVKATSTMNPDGSYTIFINSRLNREQQSDGYIHELKHILQLDFEKKHDNVGVLEAYRHAI